MSAMDRETGKSLSGPPELEQAIDQIFRTYPGDRIMRAEYGSKLFDLVDVADVSPSGRAKIAQECAGAVRRFEPRIRLDQVTTEANALGDVTQTIYGTILASGQRVTINR